MKAIISGGGIGGLNAALCLHMFGWDVELVEQASEIGEVGAGIQISPNGVKVLRALGIADAVEVQAFRPLYTQIRGGRSGRSIATTRMGDTIETRHRAPYWHIHRADLIAALASAVEDRMPKAVRTGAKVASYGQDDGGAWVELANGERLTGDIVIGADGIKSAIRDQMLGTDRPRFTGNVAWRATVPVSKLGANAPPPAACVWVGEGKHAVTYLLKNGTLANLVGIVERDDWAVESWTEKGTHAEAAADFAGWHPIITTLIDKADAHYRWAVFDRKPLEQWVDGRVALLGDACHPMLPSMAQGAVMAIEDGYVLAQTLSDQSDVAHALSVYAALRQPRTARVQSAARRNIRLFHQRTLLGKAITYGPLWLASRIAPNTFDGINDWLFGHDVTTMQNH